jgi:hypothetical protein
VFPARSVSPSLRLQAGPAPPRYPSPIMLSEAPSLLLSLALVSKSLQEQLSLSGPPYSRRSNSRDDYQCGATAPVDESWKCRTQHLWYLRKWRLCPDDQLRHEPLCWSALHDPRNLYPYRLRNADRRPQHLRRCCGKPLEGLAHWNWLSSSSKCVGVSYKSGFSEPDRGIFKRRTAGGADQHRQWRTHDLGRLSQRRFHLIHRLRFESCRRCQLFHQRELQAVRGRSPYRTLSVTDNAAPSPRTVSPS